MDTIAAISTARGRSAIAVVRASGPDVAGIMTSLFKGQVQGRKPVLRWLTHPESGDAVDRVLVTYYPAPHSYTGEDVLEVSCHGGALSPQLVLEAIQTAGARPAEPGEFTRRAYLNGKLDLLQAEAILDLVDGRSLALHRAALRQLDRGLSRRIDELRAAIVHCESLCVYEIDFPDEDEGPIPAERIDAAAEDVVSRIEHLLETAVEGELLREGALTVIAGRPNVGKSSLFNALCGFERVIVTDQPGTTRDAIEAVITLSDFPFRLVDTAGLREPPGAVERIGIEVARRYLAGADLVLFCAEAGRALDAEEVQFLDRLDAQAVTLVRTKADQVEASGGQPPDEGTPRAPLGIESLHVSALTGAGLAALRDRLVRSAFSGTLALDAEAPLVTRKRHARQLRGARDEVLAFLEARAQKLAPEVAATHLRAAAQAMEELLGVIGPDDLLAHVFSQFCIGK